MNQVKLNEIIKSKTVNIPLYVLRMCREFNLNVDELILLLFLYDKDGELFDPSYISQNLNMEMDKVLESISSIVDKGLISVVTKTNDLKIREEVFDLSALYDKITLKIINELNSKEEKSVNVYDIIETELARKLTPMECEMIDDWKNNNYPNELIVEGIREATLNGVKSLRYIDKILYEWNKNGYKKREDIKRNPEKKEKVEIYNCDWLESDEEL